MESGLPPALCRISLNRQLAIGGLEKTKYVVPYAYAMKPFGVESSAFWPMDAANSVAMLRVP
jgi:hypothetical protein